MTRHLLLALLPLQALAGLSCPICQGWGQPSIAQQLIAAPQAVLAAPTADPARFRVLQLIKGERPPDPTIEGGYPRAISVPDNATGTNSKPLLLVRDDMLPTWVILGAIDPSRANWLRALAAGKWSATMTPAEWRARVELSLPHLDDPEPLAASLAYAELVGAPYSALRAVKPNLHAAVFRPCLADPELAARQPVRLLLLGLSGNARDAARLEQNLHAAWQAGEAANVSSMLAADLELRGPERVAWVETNYLADPKRTSAEIKAALLALSVHGEANGTISRERVIQAYRLFAKAHPETAGDVAPDLAAWQYWDAVPDYLALMKSGVRQQYPSRLAVLAYLQKSPNAKLLGFVPEATRDANSAGPWNSPLPAK